MDGTCFMSDFIQPWQYLERAFKVHPDRAAFANTKRTLSYTALTMFAKQMAGMLRARGVKPGDIVAINLPTLTFTTASFAVFHEAAVVMPFNRSALKAGVRPDWVMTNVPVKGVPPEIQILVNDKWINQMSRESATSVPNEYPSKDSVIRILFTSGTTGTPKAVAFTIESALERALTNKAVSLAGRGRLLSLFGPSGGPAGWYVWYASFVNQTTYIAVENAREAVAMLAKVKLPAVFGSPSHIRDIVAVLRETGTTLPKLELIEYSGGPLPLRVFDELDALTYATVGGTLGTSEIGSITHLMGRPREVGHVGEILDFVDVEVVDEQTGEPLPDGTTGLLRFRRDLMVTEYVGDPDTSSEVFRDGWFYPGDIGRKEGNELVIEGRSSERFNIGGIKIAPTAVDAAFLALDDIDDCAAFAVASESGVDEIHLAYVASGEVTDERFASVGTVATRGVPITAFHRVESIPRNEMGKPMRRDLAAQFGGAG